MDIRLDLGDDESTATATVLEHSISGPGARVWHEAAVTFHLPAGTLTLTGSLDQGEQLRQLMQAAARQLQDVLRKYPVDSGRLR